MGKNFSPRKGQYLPADTGQHFAMPPVDYRRLLRANLRAALAHRGLTRNTLRAFYLAGPKKGERVSGRTVGNMQNASPEAPSPSLDVIAAVAHALGLEPWQLLVPGFDPQNPPLVRLTEDERKLYAEFHRLRQQLSDLDQ